MGRQTDALPFPSIMVQFEFDKAIATWISGMTKKSGRQARLCLTDTQSMSRQGVGAEAELWNMAGRWPSMFRFVFTGFEFRRTNGVAFIVATMGANAPPNRQNGALEPPPHHISDKLCARPTKVYNTR